MFYSLLIVLLVTLYGGRRLGWFRGPASWQDSSGWAKIASPLLPTSGDLLPAAMLNGDEPDIRWLGHSGFFIQWKGVRILIDPNANDWCTVSRRIMEKPADLSELGEIDAALISHAHYDHMDEKTLYSLSQLKSIILPQGSEVFLNQETRRKLNVVPLPIGKSYRIGSIEIIPVPAAHNGNRFHPLRSEFLAVGYILRTSDRTVYYSGDTARRNSFEEIRSTYHPDIAILPIGAYSPRFPLGLHHINPEEAVEVAQILGVQTVIPCHFGTFTLSLDAPDQALPRFAKAACEQGVRWMIPEFLTEKALLTFVDAPGTRPIDAVGIDDS